MAHSFEMGPIETTETPQDVVHRAPSRAKSSLTDDRITSRMGATQELKDLLYSLMMPGKPQLGRTLQIDHTPRRHG